MTRRIFFNTFNALFGTYRTDPADATTHTATKVFETASRKVGRKKVSVFKAGIRVTAEWGVKPAVAVESFYVDGNGNEIRQGRAKGGLTIEDAHAEAETRYNKLVI